MSDTTKKFIGIGIIVAWFVVFGVILSGTGLNVFGITVFEGILNPVWIGVILFAIQQLYIVPKFASTYRKVIKVIKPQAKVSLDAQIVYTPLINESSIIDEPYSNILTYSTVVTAVSFVIAAFNAVGYIVSSPESAANITTTILWIGILSFVVGCVARGMGYLKLTSMIDLTARKVIPMPTTVSIYGKLSTALLFIPLLRSFPIMDKTATMQKVLNVGLKNKKSMREVVK